MLKILIVGVLATVSVWFFVSEDRVLNLIERDLGKQVENALSDADREKADYFVAGRDIIVQLHRAEDENRLSLLRSKLASIPGSSQVLLTGAVDSSDVAIAAAALSNSNKSATFAEIQFKDNALTLVGAASAQNQTDELLSGMVQNKDVELLNYLQYKNQNSAEWLGLLNAYSTLFPSFEPGRVLITDKAISISLDNTYAAKQLAQELKSQGTSLPVRLADDDALFVNAAAGSTISGGGGSHDNKIAHNSGTGDNGSKYSGGPDGKGEGSGTVKTVLASSNSASNSSHPGNSSSLIESCNQELSTLISVEPIAFKYNSDEIEDQSLQTLNAVRNIITRCDTEVLYVFGHTDSHGSAEFNQQLSQRRASSVRRLIVGDSLPGWRVDAIGYGEEYPIDSNGSYEGRARNRRIEMQLGGKIKTRPTKSVKTRAKEVVQSEVTFEEVRR